MLRFRRDLLCVGIDSSSLSFVRFGGIGSKRVLDHFSVKLNEPASEQAIGHSLSKALSSPCCAGTRARIAVADGFFRYFVAERPSGARSLEELTIAAQLRFEDLFGTLSADWSIRLDLQPFADAMLACAMRSSLLNTLESSFETAGVSIDLMEPFAVAELNRRRTSQASNSERFIVIERSGLWYGQRRDGRWVRAQWHANSGSVVDAIKKIVAQETLRNGETPADDASPLRIFGLAIAPELLNSLAPLSASFDSATTCPPELQQWADTYHLALSSKRPRCA